MTLLERLSAEDRREHRLRDLFWLYIPWSGLLFGFGGWTAKWTRRWLLPISGGLLAWRYGLAGWRCLGYAISTMLVFSLGYSPERNNWLTILAILTSYGVTPLILFQWRKHQWWMYLMPPIVTGIGLSLCFAGLQAAGWPHKWFEIAAGMTHSLWVALAIWEHEGR